MQFKQISTITNEIIIMPELPLIPAHLNRDNTTKQKQK